MKIVLATSFFPPSHTSGTEKRTLGYAESLKKLGHEVQVVCAGRWEQDNRYWNGFTDEVYRQIPVRRVHLNWTLASDVNRFLYHNPIVEENFGRWLAQWKPDILHVTSCVSLSASIIQAAKNRNIPVVLTLTDFWFVCPRVNLLRGDGSLCDGQTTAWDCLRCALWHTKAYRGLRSVLPETIVATVLTQISQRPGLNGLRGLRGMAFDMEHRKSFLRQMLQSADYVTAPSTRLGEIISSCVPNSRISILYSGHDLSWLDNHIPRQPGGALRIGYIGQITFIKGVHFLLSAFYASKVASRAELDIFGDHTSDTAYHARLENMGVGQNATVRFNGAFSHENLGEVLSRVDVLVVPSLWHENNPRVIQEAFAAKIPVIATNVGGISEFVKHGLNGLLFERDNVEDLARQLQRIVNEPDLLKRLRQGIPPVKSIVEEMSEFVAIYRELIASRSSLDSS